MIIEIFILYVYVHEKRGHFVGFIFLVQRFQRKIKKNDRTKLSLKKILAIYENAFFPKPT